MMWAFTLALRSARRGNPPKVLKVQPDQPEIEVEREPHGGRIFAEAIGTTTGTALKGKDG